MNLPDVAHPATGLKCVHVIPPEWGPFVDIHACYTRFSQLHPWCSVISPAEFMTIPLQGNPEFLFILWTSIDVGPISPGRAVIVGVYMEAIGAPEKMVPWHVAHLEEFKTFAKTYDGVLVHTPSMVNWLRAREVHAQVHCFPVGWDPEVMGRPRFTTHKHNPFVFYGSIVHKRSLVIPFLKERLEARLAVVNGLFGRQISGVLDTAKANLYIAHSDVESYSTWRIWQTIATSAAIVGEPGDSWPMQPEHSITIPRITLDNALSVAETLKTIGDSDVMAVAKRAHNDLGPEYTVEKCVEKYLIPAIATIAGQVKQTRG